MARSRRSPVQKYHDRVAGRYDDSYDDAYWRWHDSLTWGYLKPFLPRDASAQVLDLGCGTGKWGAKIAKSGFSVTAVDISTKMVDRAKARFAQAGLSARGSFLQADLEDLSALPSGPYSLAVAMGDPIGCTTSPARAMKEIRRVLADQGTLVATFDNRLAAIDYYLKKGSIDQVRRFLRDGRTHWLTKDTEERFPIHTYKPSDLRRLLESAGFELLDLIGKTVLPMRHYRGLLATPEARRRWARIEKSLCRDPAAIGRASHLQVVCRVASR